MLKRQSKTVYQKSRPLGLRSRRLLQAKQPKESLGAKPAAQTFTTIFQQVRKKCIAQTRSFRRTMQRQVYRKQQQQLQATQRTKAIIASLALLLFFSVAIISRAEPEQKTFRIQPQSCAGWDRSEKAQEIQALGNTGLALFPQDASAQAGGGAGAAQLVCKNFALPNDFGTDASFSKAELVLSVAGKGGQDSEDLLVMESSLDGKTWTRLDSFGLNQDFSNAQHGGYWRFPFPLLHRGNIDTFQVRVRYIALSPDAAPTIYVDGLSLDVEQVVKPKREPLFLAGDVVKVEDTQLKNSEDPILKVEVEKQSRFSFLSFTKTERTVESKKLVGPDGAEVPAEYEITRVTEGRSTFERIEVQKDSLHKPGKYTAEITIVQGNKETTVKKDFYWGVLVLNTPKSIYRPGESIDVGMGVLDPQGHTICDARLWLTVKNPSGRVQNFSTDEQTIARSTECGPITVTNVPDYSAVYEGGDEGMYSLDLKAETKFGEYTIQDSIAVRATVAVDVHRDAPTRIYPAEDYPVTLTIRPQKDVIGFFEDSVPSTFGVYDVSEKGKTLSGNDRLTIRWPVEWKGGKTYTLSYRMNPPDVSPELFLLGKARLLKAGSTEPVFEEYRHWQIASDAVGTASFTRLWSSGFELQTVTADEEFTATVGTAPTIDTSTFRSGVAALKTNESAATSGATYQYSSADSANDYYFRAYVYITNMPETRVNLMEFYDSGNSVQASIRLNSNGTLELWNDEDNAQQTGTSGALSTNTWYRLEFRYDATTIASTYLEARVDGVTFSSGTVNHANGATRIRIGTLTTDTGGASTMYWDDLAINSDDAGITASIPENWPGPGKIVMLLPDGQPNGASSDTCAGSTTSWQAVDERGTGGPDDATTTVLCDTANDFLEVSLEASSSQGINANDSILVAQVGSRATKIDTSQSASFGSSGTIPGTGTIQNGTNSTIAAATTGYHTNAGAAPRNYSLSLYGRSGTIPPTAAATPADIDSATIRFRAPDATPDIRVTAMWLTVEYEPAEGGRLWSSGFESQSVTAGEEWAGISGGPTINTTATYYRSGGASLRINGFSSGSAEGVSQDFVAANADGPYYARAYLRIETLPSAGNRILAFRDSGSTDRVFLVLTSTGTLELHDEDSGGTPIGTSAALSTSTWYRVEFQINSSGAGATDTVEARINGTNFGSSATRNLANGVTTIVLGGNLNAESQTQGDWYFDDVAVNQNAGSTQNGYPGAGSIAVLKPNAAGDNSGFTNDYTYIDEADPDDASTYIYTGAANAITDVNVFDSSTQGIGASDTVTLVSVGMRANKANSTSFVASARLKDSANGTVIEGNQQNFTSTTWVSHSPAQPRIYGLTTYSRPQQSTAWTTTTLDSAQIGVRNLNTGSAISPEQLQVTTLWMLVEYVPNSISIYGKIYTNETPTAYDCSGNTITVRASVNGSASEQTADCTLSNGSFAITAARPSSAADPVAIFIDSGESIKGTTVTLAADTTSDIVDLHIYQDHTSVRHQNAGPMTNAKLATGDNGNAGIRYSISSSNLTVESGMEFHVWAGATYDPGGTVTTNSTGGDFHVDDGGTAYLDNATNTIGRDILVDGGATLNIDADTIVAGGDITTAGTSAVVARTTGSATTTMRSNGSIGGGTTPTLTFYNLVIGDGTTATTTLSSAATTATGGDVSVGTGSTFTVGADLTVGGGDFTNTTTGIIASSGTPTVTMRGTGNLGTNGASGAITIYNLVIGDGTAATTTVQKAATISNNLTVGNGSVASSATVAVGTLTVTGNVVVATSSTMTVNASVTVNGGNVTGDGTITTASGSPTFTLTGTGNFGGATAWTFYNLSFTQVGCSTVTTTATGGGGITINNVLTTTGCFAGDTFTHTLNAGSKTWILPASGIPFVNNGELVGATSTFRYTGAGSTTIATANYNTLELQPSSGTRTYDISGGFTVSGDLTMSSTASLALTVGTGTVIMNGTSGTLNGGGQTLYNLSISKSGGDAGVTVSTTNITVSNTLLINSTDTLTIASGRTLTHTGTTFTLTGTLSGPGKYLVQNTITFPTAGALTNGIIIDFDLVGGTQTMSARSDYKYVQVRYSGLFAPVPAEKLFMETGTINIANDFTIAGSKSLTVDAATGNPTVSIGGDLTFESTGTKTLQTGSGTWTVSGNVNLTNGTLSVASGNTLVMNGSGKTLTTNGEALQNLTLSGSITLANETHWVYGDVSFAGGTITAGSSTLMMRGTSNTITGAGQTLNNLTIDPASAGTITLQTSDLTVSGTLAVSTSDALTINASRNLIHTGATLTLNGTINGPGRLTYRSATAFPTTGTLASSLILQMDATSNDQSMGARTDYQKVEIDNSGTTAGRTVTAGTAGSQTLTIASTLDLLNTGTGSSTTIFQVNTWDPAFTVTGNVTIAGDTTFEASSATTTNFGAGFSNSGTFTHNSGTIALTTSAASTIAGSTTFQNLSVSGIGAAKTITFVHGTTQTIAGTWTVTGSAGNLITLQRDNTSAWTVNPTAASVSYVDVSWSTNIGVAFCATFSQSTSGNNTGWQVSAGASCGIDVSGTSNSSGGTVKVAVNGSIQGQSTTLASSWTISGVTVNTGNTVTVFVDSVADSAETTAVTKYDGSGNITGLVLDTNVLSIGSADNPSLTVTELGQYDADENENILHTANSNTLAAQAGGTYTSATLSILSGATLSISGTETLTAKNVTIGGALTSGGNSVYTIAGTLTNNGTFTQSTSTVTMTGTSNSLTGSTASTFNNLTINPASTGTITVSTSDLTVSGTLDVADGDTLSIGSSRTVNAPGTTTLNTSGTISGAGTLRFTDASSGPGTGGTLSSGVRYDATAGDIASTTLDARTYGGQVELYGASNSPRTFTLASGTYTLSGASSHFIINEAGDDTLTVTGDANDPTVTIGGNLDYNGTTGVVVTGSGVWTVGGNADFTGGTYTASTDNTLKMNGTSKTLTAAGNELQKFEVSGGSIATADTVLVNKTFDITGGGFTQAANANLTVYGNFTIANGTTFTAASGSGILIMDGNPDPMTFTDNSSPKQDMGNVQIGLSPGTTDLGSDFTAKSVIVASGDTFNTNGYDLDIGTGGITIAGTLDATDDVETDETQMDTDGKFDLQSGGTFTPDQSTLKFTISPLVVANATNDFITVGSGNPYNVIVDDGGGTYTLTIEVEDPVVVSNNVTITGGTLDAKSGENNAISVGNNWTNNDSFVPRSGAVTFTATDTGNTIGGTMGDLDDFYDLVFNGSGGEWTTNTAMTVGNDLTVTAGSLLGATDITMYGTLAGGGTVTRTGGTFLQRVAAAENFGSTSNASNWTFNNLTLENSSASDRTVTFATGGTGQVIVSGTLTVGNASDTNVTTLDNETNDRVLDANGAVTITSKGLLNASSTASFTVAGNWTNSGDFTDNTGTVTLDGAAQQSLSGQLTGANDRFYNLTVTNASGSNPESSPSVIFATDADVANNFRAETASTKLRFNAGDVYTFENVFFNGQATGTRVYLRSSSTGTLWDLTSAGTQTVSNTDVRDSNACPGDDIDATDGTNYDSTNNPCWNINTLTFSISDMAIGFGSLSATAARWANGAATGSAVATAAHTLGITTNARSGYAITYNGATLSGPEDISAATFTGDADGTPSSEQFAISITTDGNATIPSAYQKASNNYSFVPSTVTTLMSETGPTAIETASVYYICNISSATTAGAYSTSISYIATTTF